MKEALKIILGICIVTFSIFSCSKDEDNKLKQPHLSKHDIVNIGKMHNQILSEAFKNFDYNSLDSNPYIELREKMIALKIDNVSERDKIKSIDFIFNNNNLKSNKSKPNSSPVFDIEYIKSNTDNKEATILLEQAYQNLNDIENHADFSKSLNSLKNEADLKLNGTDFEVTLSYIVVLEQSSYFWKPMELGGSGEGYQILLNQQSKFSGNNLKRKVSPCTKAVIAADGAAAASACLAGGVGGWIVGALNPTAFAARVAIASAAGSGYAYLTNPACDDDVKED